MPSSYNYGYSDPRKRELVAVKVDKATKIALEKECIERHISMSELIREKINAYSGGLS